jgi:hypothetical protein
VVARAGAHADWVLGAARQASPSLEDAKFFAARRGKGTVLQFTISKYAQDVLKQAGAVRQPIPAGKATNFLGEELFVKPEHFSAFNDLIKSGDIIITPARF